MVDTSTLAGVMRASQPQADQLARRTAGVRQPAPRPQPQPPRPQPPRPQPPVPGPGSQGGMDDWYLQTWNQNIDEPITQPFVNQPISSFFKAFFSPEQAIGGMHRDVYNQLRHGESPTTSPGIRALQDIFNTDVSPLNYESEWQGLADDVIEGEQLSGPAAGAVRGGSVLAEILTGGLAGGALAGGGIAGAKAGIKTGAKVASRVAPAFQDPAIRQAVLMRRILTDPDTYVQTTRSTGSLDDILQGGFRSSKQTGVTSSGAGNIDQYNSLRGAAEGAAFGPNVENVQYGGLVSPVLRNQPRPFPIGRGGRQALQDYLSTARSLDPSITAPYGTATGNQPIQYVWSPEAMRNARFYYGDSMFNQSTGGGRDYTQPFSDFLNSFVSPSTSPYTRGGPPRPYVEAQIPSLSIDDIVSIQSLNSGATGRNVVNQIDEALANVGRDIPTGIAQSLEPSDFQMPPTVRERFNALLSRLRSQKNSPGMTLDEWEALEFNNF